MWHAEMLTRGGVLLCLLIGSLAGESRIKVHNLKPKQQLTHAYYCFSSLCKDNNIPMIERREMKWVMTISLEQLVVSMQGEEDEKMTRVEEEEVVVGAGAARAIDTYVPRSFCYHDEAAQQQQQQHPSSLASTTATATTTTTTTSTRTMMKATTTAAIQSLMFLWPYWLLTFVAGMLTSLVGSAAFQAAYRFWSSRVDRYIIALEKNCTLLLRKNKATVAIGELEKGMNYLSRNGRGDDHLDTAAVKHLLAKAYIAHGASDDLVKAATLLREVLLVYAPFGEDAHTAHCLEDLALSLEKQGKQDEAIENYIKAVRIYSNDGSDEHIVVLSPSGEYKTRLQQLAGGGGGCAGGGGSRSLLATPHQTPIKNARSNNSAFASKTAGSQTPRSLSKAFDSVSLDEFENMLKRSDFRPCSSISPIKVVVQQQQQDSLPFNRDTIASPTVMRLHQRIGELMLAKGQHEQAQHYYQNALEISATYGISASPTLTESIEKGLNKCKELQRVLANEDLLSPEHTSPKQSA